MLVTGFDVATLADRELSALRATRIGFVFQQFFLAEHQSVLDNVGDGLLYAGASLAERRRAASQALLQVGLADKLTSLPPSSPVASANVLPSPGPRGPPGPRAGGRAHGQPGLGLGGIGLELFAELNAEGSTIAVITHDMGVAARTNRVVRLLDGLVV